MRKLSRRIFLSSGAAALAARRLRAGEASGGPVIPLFNGSDLTGLYGWLRDSKYEDPKRVFSVQDGMIRISGDDFGYLATEREYENYHLAVEYKWGSLTYGSKTVRNSGVLLHALGPDGNRSPWMSSIECQLAQGCVGDLIVIRGRDAAGNTLPVTITSETVLGPDGRTRWKKGGKRTPYAGKQFWWSEHDPQFQETIDTRGRWDVESLLGKWTRVECICNQDRITIVVNGRIVNECFEVFPSRGKILLEAEGFEIFFRKFELRPLTQNA